MRVRDVDILSDRRLAATLALVLLLGMNGARALPASPVLPDLIRGDGFETFAPAHLIVHYPAGAHFISARGNGAG